MKKLTIEEMQKIAESKGGRCLSKEYVSARTKLKWQCSKGHVWEAVPSSIKQGSWCPFCAGMAKLTIEEMKELARSRGGKCLSDVYVNANTPLKWECKEDHIWEAKPNHIKHGHWCPYCAGIGKLTIEEMKELAISRGGECLSDVYESCGKKLKWKCGEGHIWEATPENIKQGKWCPYCNVYISEKICRGCFEVYLEKNF